MKKWFIITILMGFATHHISQSLTFNKRFHLGFPSTQLTNVLATDSGYYVVGIIADSIFPYRTGNLFLKLDLEGNILLEKTIRDTAKTYEVWLPTLITTQDGQLAAAGYSFDSTMQAMLIKYNTEGDSILFKQYLSLFYPEQSFISPYGLVETVDSGFVLVSWVKDTFGVNNPDISIIKTNSEGTLVSQNSYGNELWNRPASIIRVGNTDTYIVGAVQQNINFVNSNFTSRTHIFKIDSIGHTQWTYLSPIDQLQDAANSMVLTPDGGIVVATQRGIEVSTNPTSGTLYWESGLIFKLNANRQLEWEVEFRDPNFRSFFNTLNKIIRVSDKTYTIPNI